MHTRRSSCTPTVCRRLTIVFWIIMKHKNLRLVRLSLSLVFISPFFFFSHSFPILFVFCLFCAWCWCSVCRHRDHGHVRWSPDAVDCSKKERKKLEKAKKTRFQFETMQLIVDHLSQRERAQHKWCMAMVLHTHRLHPGNPIQFSSTFFFNRRQMRGISLDKFPEWKKNFSRKTNNAIA